MQRLSGSEHFAATVTLLNGTYARLRARLARLVAVQFCCNGPAGLPMGKAVLATIGADLHLDGPPGPDGCAYRVAPGAIVLAGRPFPHAGYVRHRPTREWDEARRT